MCWQRVYKHVSSDHTAAIFKGNWLTILIDSRVDDWHLLFGKKLIFKRTTGIVNVNYYDTHSEHNYYDYYGVI